MTGLRSSLISRDRDRSGGGARQGAGGQEPGAGGTGARPGGDNTEDTALLELLASETQETSWAG